MFTLIVAEAALENVPKELHTHPSVHTYARSKGKKPGEILLDRSLHHAAMHSLKDSYRRGRPDLVHLVLLEATCTPLYLDNLLSIYLHTALDYVIEFGAQVRLPKSYFRFEGLMEQLFRKKRIEYEGRVLMSLKKCSFKDLIEQLRPSKVIGLSTLGVESGFEDVAHRILSEEKPAFVVGGFPRGHFSDRISSCLDTLYRVHKRSLEAHTVVARLIYEIERQMKRV